MVMVRRDFLAVLVGTTALSTLRAQAGPTALVVSPRRMASDPRRPKFHFLPAANWMNDPNGPVFWKGNYHMFYQYNPNGPIWGDMHWGHAVSRDMVHWKHLPVALAPTPGGADADGCFSGTSVVKDDRVIMLYTGVRTASEADATIKNGAGSLRETQCMVTANDADLQTWSKQRNPVIVSPPEGLDVNGFRDPSPWRQGAWWYMVLGSGIANKGGAVLLYRSKDLQNWEYMHVFAQRDQTTLGRFDPFDPGEVWECPEFFRLGEKHLLIFSTGGKVYWRSGSLDEATMTFHPEQSGVLDHGAFYAAKTQLDKSGNRIVWGWVQETRPVEEYKAAGWAGMMSLPRVISLDGDGLLKIAVADEVNQLREHEHTLTLTTDEEANRRQIASLTLDDCCGEIRCAVRRGTTPFELTIFDSVASDTPFISVRYDPRFPGQIFKGNHGIPIHLHEGENLEFHLYFDGSVIETFVNGQVAWTDRFYYPSYTPRNLALRWTGKTTEIERLSVWNLAPISDDRLTS